MPDELVVRTPMLVDFKINSVNFPKILHLAPICGVEITDVVLHETISRCIMELMEGCVSVTNSCSHDVIIVTVPNF